jgi:hypothetical protein
MNFTNVSIQPPRRYAKRFRGGPTRDTTLSVRVTSATRRAVRQLAASRAMSCSEYLCRFLNDHLHAHAGALSNAARVGYK